jgi:hypothetical protein
MELGGLRLNVCRRDNYTVITGSPKEVRAVRFKYKTRNGGAAKPPHHFWFYI